MKKAIFTLNVNDYSKEISSLTYPYIQKYANKIGADFRIIDTRKYPEFPVTYEKLQIYELGSLYEWIIYIDSDALIHPNMFDVTEILAKDTVMTYDCDYAIGRFKYNDYFRRDGRHIGAGNWFTIASQWCLDLWKPCISNKRELIEITEGIYPTRQEELIGIQPEHLIDDYVLSLNIARFGLKYATFLEYFKDRVNPQTFLHHNYLLSTQEKIASIKDVIARW